MGRPQLDNLTSRQRAPDLRYVEVYAVGSALLVRQLKWEVGTSTYVAYGSPFAVGIPGVSTFHNGDRLWVVWRSDSRRWQPVGVVGAGADLPTIYIVNIQGAPLRNRSIVGIGAPLIQPNGNAPTPDQLPNQPLFYSAPVNATKPFAIILGDIAQNDIVQAITVGVLAIRVYVGDITHLFAAPQNNNSSYMTSATSGPCRILWKQFQDQAGSAALGLQWAFIETPWVEPDGPTDIRAISYGSISAARGIQGGPVTPGTGLAKLYTMPTSGPAGTPWQFVDDPVTVENSMFGVIDTNKPIQLKRSRLDDTGKQIYIVSAQGCAIVPPSGGG